MELGPELDLVHQQLGHAYLQKGMFRKAIAALRRAADLSGERDSAHLAYAYAVAGARSDAECMMQALTIDWPPVGGPVRMLEPIREV